MCDQYEELAKKNEELLAKLSAMEECKKRESRISAFVNRGFSKEDAESKANELVSLDDITFDKVIKLISTSACCQKVAPTEISFEELEEEKEVEASVDLKQEEENAFASLLTKADKYFSEKWSNHNGDE